jgi:hypothetical protein
LTVIIIKRWGEREESPKLSPKGEKYVFKIFGDYDMPVKALN